MFSEQKRQRELKFQQEIIRKTLEDQGYNIDDFDTGLELVDNEDYENAIIYLTRCANNDNSQAQYELAYKNGFKRAGLLLRELRYEENKNLSKDVDMDFENKISDLGFVIDIPKNWVKLDPKNKNCFDAVAIDSFDGDVIFNIKMQVFLIEIPENMSYCVDLERVANNMGCIESVNFNNGNCNGKLICGEGIDGTCEYIFVSKGRRGVYDLRVMVDKYLEPIYEDIIDHIIYSFDIIDKI